MTQMLSNYHKRLAAPGCRLLEDLNALRKLEGALDIIEAQETHAKRNMLGFTFRPRQSSDNTTRTQPLTDTTGSPPHQS